MSRPNSALKKAASSYNKSLSPFQDFHIHCGTFDFGFNVILSEDKERCAKYVNEKLEMERFSSLDFESLGKVFFRGGYCPVLWLPKYPTTHGEIGTLNHELLHIVIEVMGWAGISLSPSSEEAFTHLMKYVTVQFYEKAVPPTQSITSTSSTKPIHKTIRKTTKKK